MDDFGNAQNVWLDWRHPTLTEGEIGRHPISKEGLVLLARHRFGH